MMSTIIAWVITVLLLILSAGGIGAIWKDVKKTRKEQKDDRWYATSFIFVIILLFAAYGTARLGGI